MYIGGYTKGATGIIKFIGVLDYIKEEVEDNFTFSLPTKRYAQVITKENQLWTLGAGHPHQWTALGGRVHTDEQMLKLSGLSIISEGVDEEINQTEDLKKIVERDKNDN